MQRRLVMGARSRSIGIVASADAIKRGLPSGITAQFDDSGVTRRAAIALLLAVAALALPALVVGHAALVESDPADGATITTPYTLSATFNEELDLEASTLQVQNAAGADVASGAPDPDDPTTMIAQLPALPDGEYTVRWTAVTPNDGAVERGTFTFTVGAAATPSPTPGFSILPTNPPTTPAPGAPGSNDLLIALVLAAVAIAAVVGFVFLRSRR